MVNYKTLDLTRLCLRSIRKFTRCPYKVVVIDNGSNDSSTQYLRNLPWIELIERQTVPGESGGQAHARALQLALDNCDTELFVSMHSDCVITQPGWLTLLIEKFDDKTACVGTGKIEMSSPIRDLLKNLADFKTLKRKLQRTPDPLGIYRYYNRTVCCIYRTAILKKENLTFTMDQEKGLTAGKKLYFELVDRGYKTVELPEKHVRKYILHLTHATMVLNDAQFNVRYRTKKRIHKLIKKIMNSELIRSLDEDRSLDNPNGDECLDTSGKFYGTQGT